MTFLKIRKELADQKRVEGCAREFGVVGDKTRLKICYLLCRHPELSVSQIASLIDISVSRTSHSLQRLRDINLVKRRVGAQNRYYSLKSSGFSKFLKEYLTQ